MDNLTFTSSNSTTMILMMMTTMMLMLQVFSFETEQQMRKAEVVWISGFEKWLYKVVRISLYFCECGYILDHYNDELKGVSTSTTIHICM